MGRAVRIVQKRRLTPDVLRYEVDRSLTGMAHEAFSGAFEPNPERPAELISSRLLKSENVKGVHVFSNLITVTTSRELNAHEESTLDEVVADLFIHYLPGVLPTPIPDPEPAEVTSE